MSFRTNLDKAKPYVDRLNTSCNLRDARVSVGDRVRFWSEDRKRAFDLVVCSRVHDTGTGITEYELHLPGEHHTIREWEEWFLRHMERLP